jgi:hypothetical protein
MLKATDTDYAPWLIVKSDDKRRARLSCISKILELVPFKKMPRSRVKLPRRSTKQPIRRSGVLEGKKVGFGNILRTMNGTQAHSFVLLGF